MNNSSLGKDALSLTVSKVTTLVLSVAVSMLLARFRTLEEYGTYSQMLLVINLVSSLLMLGLPNSLNYFLPRAGSDEERQRFLSVYYTVNTFLSLIIGAVLVFSVPIIEAYFDNPLIHSFIYFLALMPWATLTAATVENILVVYGRARFMIVYQLASVMGQLTVVVGVQLLGYGFKTYLICSVILNCLLALAVYFIVIRLSGGIRFSLDKHLIKMIFAFSIPIGLAGMVGTVNTDIDKLLIGWLMDTEQLAVYTNAAKELPLSIVSSSITAVLLPKLTLMVKNKEYDEAVRLWGTAAELAFIIISLIVAGVFTFAPDVLSFLYSDKYLPGVNVFRVYTLVLLLRCTYFGMILNALGHTKKILACSIASLLLNTALNPLMYMLFGMIGPAIATLIAMLLIILLQLKMSADAVFMPLSRVFPWKSIGVVLTVNIAMSAVFCAIKYILPIDRIIGSFAESLLLGGAWAALYIVLMKKRIILMWGVLNKGDAD